MNPPSIKENKIIIEMIPLNGNTDKIIDANETAILLARFNQADSTINPVQLCLVTKGILLLKYMPQRVAGLKSNTG